MSRSLWIALAACCLAACQGQGDGPPASGAVQPTVAGGAAAPSYASYADARRAFTRRSADEVLEATLEDAAWLRFEGTPEQVQRAHRAYFEFGYTSFHVVLRAKKFTRPTHEKFVLEDSNGARATSSPVTFQGNLTLVKDRWEYAFDLSFQHTITKDTRWVKLTRVDGGSSVRWDLGAAAPR
jgi:hypothetical protein